MSASLTIKRIPDSLHQDLKESAAAHHRSLNGEILYRLQESLRPSPAGSQMSPVPEEDGDREQRLQAIEDLLEFGRGRSKTPTREMLEMIREGRR